MFKAAAGAVYRRVKAAQAGPPPPTPVITGPVIVDDHDGTGSWTATTDIACTSLGMDYGAVTTVYTQSSLDIATGTSFGEDIPQSAGTAFGRWFYRMYATTAAGFAGYITTESTFDINAVLTNASDGTPTTDGATAPQVDINCSTAQIYLAVALATQSPDPTEAQIIAGTGGGIVFAENQAASGTGTQTFGDITGLSASTDYKIWYTATVQGATATKTHADLTTASAASPMVIVQAWQTKTQTNNPVSDSLPNAPTAGSVVVCVAKANDSLATASDPTDDFGDIGGTTWGTPKSHTTDVNTGSSNYIWTRVVGTGATGKTVSMANSGFSWSFFLSEYANPDATNVIDGSATSGAGSLSVPQPSAAITTTLTSDLVVCLVLCQDATLGAGTGYTLSITGLVSGITSYIVTKITTASGNYTPLMNGSTAFAWAASAVAVKGQL